MMGRIADAFKRNDAGKKAFIPFVTAGDPDLDVSLDIIKCLADSGADIIEIGVPFSDPMADGPTIQRSSQRALNSGTNLHGVLELVRKFRTCSEVPIVLFSYLNPLLRFGIADLARASADIGIDGILVTDAAGYEASQIAATLQASGVDLISLMAPTTTDSRIRDIASTATGFLYAVSRTGVTGAQSEASADAQKLVERARRFTELPIAVGFGISTARQVADVWTYADGAVVGSAIVQVIEQSVGKSDPVADVGHFVRSLLP